MLPKIVDRHEEQPIFIKEYLRDYFKSLQEQDIHYLTLLGNQFVEEMRMLSETSGNKKIHQFKQELITLEKRIEEELFYRCIFTHLARHFTDHACRIEREANIVSIGC